jgi:glycosyltransferase involved in cell wall biosynthesis
MDQSVDWIGLDMGREISPGRDLRSVLKLIKIIREQKCDILHAHSSKAGGVGRVAAWLTGVSCVYTAHGWSFDMRVSNKKRFFYKVVERFLSYMTDVIVCISQYEFESAMKAGINQKKLVKIDNGVDIKKYDIQEDIVSLKIQLGLPTDKIIIGMVARISEQKNPFFFLDIASSLRKRVADSCFVLVGDGELRQPFDERISSSDDLRDRVLVTGWVDQPELYIKCFDVGILTSKWEGFGLVLVEYMASRVPVVATNVDGIPHVISDGSSGLLCDSGSTDQFVEKICNLLEDKALVSSITDKAYKVAHEKFSIERAAEQYDLIYQKIAGKNLL